MLASDRPPAYFIVKPEESGHPTPGQASVARVHCVFDTWLGDDLVCAYPVLLVTRALRKALEGLEAPTGFRMKPARTSRSAFFLQHSPGRRIPQFYALVVAGRPGVDDMGLANGTLVVSQRTMDVLVGCRVGRAVFALYSRSELSTRRPNEEEPPGDRPE